LLASFSSTIYYDNFYLIVPFNPSGSNSVWKSIQRPFRPFTNELWMVILSVFAFVGVMLLRSHQAHTTTHASLHCVCGVLSVCTHWRRRTVACAAGHAAH
jgi:hypothetical protein